MASYTEKKFVNYESAGKVAIYQHYTNTKIKDPTTLKHGTCIEVYTPIYVGKWQKISSGPYKNWFIDISYLKSTPPEDEKKSTPPPQNGHLKPPRVTSNDTATQANYIATSATVSASQKDMETYKTKTVESGKKEYKHQNNLYMSQIYEVELKSDKDTTFEMNASFQDAIADFTNAFGSPFLYSNDTDPCYYFDNKDLDSSKPAVGHTMLSTIYSSPAIFSICPGKVSYLPNLVSKDKKSTMAVIADKFKEVGMDAMGSIGAELGSDGSIGDGGAFAKQLYAFAPDYNDYINRLNVMARISALFMGIGDKKTPWNTEQSYRNADYAFYTTGRRGTNESKPKSNALNNFLWQISTYFENGIDTTSDTYIHFFLTADGSAVEQDFTTDNARIDLLDGLQGSEMQNKVKQISFLFNGAMSNSDTWNMIESDLQGLSDSINGASDTIGSLMNMVKGWAQGGKMLIPDMIDEVAYNSSVTCHLNFRSLYGDPESVFLNVNLPCLALLCFVLPKQMAENMYGYPYVCRCFQRGYYNSDLCFISNLSFRRGGDSESSWTEKGLATEVEATFTITPLYAALMGGSARNPFLFMSNTALIEYLGNMCGLDLKVDQIELKTALISNLLADNFIPDIPNSLARGTADYFRGKLDNLFRFN